MVSEMPVVMSGYALRANPTYVGVGNAGGVVGLRAMR